MDYKAEIKVLLDSISNEDVLKYLYVYIGKLLENAEKKGQA